MKTTSNINLDYFMHLYADCIPVKGASRSVICDLTRNELIFLPSEYFEVLQYLVSDKIGKLLNDVECEEEKRSVIEFIDFLEQNELITFLKDPAMFPAIEERWDMPAIIQNAIIDVETIYHDFDKIFNELDDLGCPFVQIRSFSDLLTLEDIYRVLSSSQHKSIQSVELIIKYGPDFADEVYIKLVEDQPIISNLTIHSAPAERQITVNYGCDEVAGKNIQKQIFLVSQRIDSNLHCGNISVKALNAPSFSNFFEMKLYNGCLNRKVSIDASGEIKNCPSMPVSYGNIKDTCLSSAIHTAGFKDKWKITKDQIEICKDCEFRYVCSDCRAYLENPEDIYSKPLKCGYNPYTAVWEEWSQNPIKKKGIEYYGMDKLVERENGLQY